MKPSVTVITVNWNGGELLKECIQRLSRQTFQPNQIMIIDNASTDGSVDTIENFSNISIIKLNRNTGFAAANNIGIYQSNTDYVALLNPDAFPEPNWLEELIICAQTHPDFAAFGSKQLIHGMPNRLDGIGDIYHISGLVWRNGYRRILSESDLVSSEIFSPCAGAALYAREVLIELGGFDEDYFCYVEDVDLGFRLRLAGYKSIYVPSAVVHHVGSASTGGQHSDFSIFHGHRNLVWTFIKDMPGALLLLLLPLHLFLNIITILYFIYIGKGSIILKSKYHAIIGIPSVLKKRCSIQKNRKVTIYEIWNRLDKRLIPFRN